MEQVFQQTALCNYFPAQAGALHELIDVVHIPRRPKAQKNPAAGQEVCVFTSEKKMVSAR
jgi:hypothetical protein